MKAESVKKELFHKCDHAIKNGKEIFQRNQVLIWVCLISSFAWGFLTHAYIFLHNSFSHDSLNEFNAQIFGNDWKIQLGRVFVPVYRLFTRGDLTLPWLIGFLSILYAGMAVILTVKIFRIRSKVLMTMVAGIFLANQAFFATASSYIHDLDCNMLALLFSVFAVYLWNKSGKGFLLGIIPVALSMGLYQSYVTVTITMILLVLIMGLLEQEPFQGVLIRGLKSVGMLLGGGILYWISIQVICGLTGIAIASGNYNSVDTVLSMSASKILLRTWQTCVRSVLNFWELNTVYSSAVTRIVLGTMVIVAGLLILIRLANKKISVLAKIMTLALIALLPFALNITYILSNGVSHDLTRFSSALIYLFVLLVAWRAVEWFQKDILLIRYGQKALLVVLVFVILWGNVRLANMLYLKKDMEQDSNMAMFNRILYRIEDYEGYVLGETPVVFVGDPETLLIKLEGFDEAYFVIGSDSPNVLSYAAQERFVKYFSIVLANPINIADKETWNAVQDNEEVKEMPCYPNDGCMKMINGVLVVKLEGEG